MQQHVNVKMHVRTIKLHTLLIFSHACGHIFPFSNGFHKLHFTQTIDVHKIFIRRYIPCGWHTNELQVTLNEGTLLMNVLRASENHNHTNHNIDTDTTCTLWPVN